MWFKNLVVYRLPADWSVAPAELEEKLAQRSLQPCGSFDMQSRGWVHASAAERFVHTTHGQHLIALGVEQKLLPTSIVRQVAADRAKVIEQQQGFPVGRRQMRELQGARDWRSCAHGRLLAVASRALGSIPRTAGSSSTQRAPLAPTSSSKLCAIRSAASRCS